MTHVCLFDIDGTLLSSESRPLPDVGAAQTVSGAWALPSERAMRLIFRLRRPTGFVAFEKTLNWWDGRSGGVTVEDMDKEGYRVPER